MSIDVNPIHTEFANATAKVVGEPRACVRLRTWLRRVACIVAATVAVSTAAAVTAPAAFAWERDDGWATSSIYLSRGETRFLDQQFKDWGLAGPGVAGAMAAGACWMAGIASTACGVIGAVSYGLLGDKMGQAARKGECLRIRFIPGQQGSFITYARPTVITGLYSTGGSHCHDH